MRTGLPAVAELVDHARCASASSSIHTTPSTPTSTTPRRSWPECCGVWKPRFIHDPRSKDLVRLIIEQAGFSASENLLRRSQAPYGIPRREPQHRHRIRLSMAPRHLVQHAPAQQINWWLPIFPLSADNAMSFDPRQFDRPTDNNSYDFDYYRNNAARHTTATQVATETQPRPRALSHEADNDVIVLPAPGSVLLFSGAQLHRTIPNQSSRSRYSIDFRTVDSQDLLNGQGAPMVDVQCTGTAIRDFRRVSDCAGFDEALLVRLFGAPPADAELVFSPAG